MDTECFRFDLHLPRLHKAATSTKIEEGKICRVKIEAKAEKAVKKNIADTLVDNQKVVQ